MATYDLPTSAKSLAEVLADIQRDEGLAERKRGEIASALKTVGKVSARPLDSIAADPAELREMFKTISPVTARLSKGRWNNVRSLVALALDRTGRVVAKGRYRDALSTAWTALITQLAWSERYRLGHFAGYCTATGIEPDQVDDEVLATFLDHLKTASMKAEPKRTHREVIRAWNRCVAAVPEWPQRPLTVPDNRTRYAVPWSALPPTLVAEKDMWLAHLGGADPFSDHRPLSATSLRTREKQLMLYISALVRRGLDPARLEGFADLVQPERVAEGLRFFWEKAGKKPSLHAAQIAGVVTMIAKHWVKLGQADLDKLGKMVRKLTPRQTGMTERNRTRLRPFDDPAVLTDFHGLSSRICDEVVRCGTPTYSLALQLQTAVALDLFSMTLARIRNVAELEIGRHVLRGSRGDITIVVPEEQVKNKVPLDVALPPASAKLLDLYIQRYRPLLVRTGSSTWLFPGRTADRPKGCEGLRQQVMRCIWKRCGLRFNPHLHRHLGGKVLLEKLPGAHGLVQRMLGHRKIDTCLQYYTGLETKAAMEQYHAEVLHLRDEGDRVDGPKPSRRKR